MSRRWPEDRPPTWVTVRHRPLDAGLMGGLRENIKTETVIEAQPTDVTIWRFKKKHTHPNSSIYSCRARPLVRSRSGASRRHA